MVWASRWRGAAQLIGLVLNTAIGMGLSCNRIGAMTYALKARPHARASVQGSTRFIQMSMVRRPHPQRL